MPYEKRVCRIEHTPSCLCDLKRPKPGVPAPTRRATMEEEVEGMARAGTEVWVTHATRKRGIPLWHSKMLEPPPDADPDLISRFLDLAHQKGIIALAYYPFIFNTLLIKSRPEWAIQMLDDGGEEVWNEGWFCFNSPFRDWLPEYLSEMLDHLDFDGIYFDDMNWGAHSDTGQRWSATGCHCQYCRELYLGETGKALPTKVDMDCPDFKRYVTWRYDKFLEGVQHVADGVHKRHPDAVIDWNYYGRPFMAWRMAHPLRPLTGTTHFFMETWWDNLGAGFPAKLLRAAGPPFGMWMFASQAVFECSTHGAPYPEPHTNSVHGLSAVVRGGALVLTCLDAGPHTIYGDSLESTFTELKKLRPYVGGETVPYLALHVSERTRDFAPPDDPESSDDRDSFWRTLRGSHEVLSRSHLLTDVVFDQHITVADLSRYQVLLLSNSRCLSQAQVEAIAEFVDAGGTLLATYETSLYDEMGQRRENFGLAEVLGVDYRPQNHPEAGLVQPNIYIPQDEALRAALGHVVAYGAQRSTVAVRSGCDVRVLFRWGPADRQGRARVGPLLPGGQRWPRAIRLGRAGGDHASLRKGQGHLRVWRPGSRLRAQSAPAVEALRGLPAGFGRASHSGRGPAGHRRVGVSAAAG